MAAREPLYEIRTSSIQGKGAFALKRIKKGKRITEYVGERITDDEAEARYDDETMKRHHTFLFSLDDGTCIDAGRIGNDAKYINHSCAPNCEAINEEGRIFIEAIADIEEGDELTYDYAYQLGEDAGDDPELRKRYVCLCGAATCRGTILAKSEPKAKKKKAAKSKKKAKSGRSTEVVSRRSA